MLYDIIPTCDDPMSCYTLVAFVIYSGVLILAARFAVNRLDEQEESTKEGGVIINKLQESINAMAVDLAVVKATIADIEEDNRETRTALAEINRILIDKLT